MRSHCLSIASLGGASAFFNTSRDLLHPKQEVPTASVTTCQKHKALPVLSCEATDFSRRLENRDHSVRKGKSNLPLHRQSDSGSAVTESLPVLLAAATHAPVHSPPIPSSAFRGSFRCGCPDMHSESSRSMMPVFPLAVRASENADGRCRKRLHGYLERLLVLEKLMFSHFLAFLRP